MKRLLPAVLCLPAAVAFASEGGGGHAGIPWWELFKQAVNFGILAGLLFYLLRKPLAAFLKERSESLRKAIDDAARARKEAGEKLAAIDARVAGLPGEIAAMSRKMDAEADDEARRIREAADAEIGRVREQARFAAEQELKKAVEELRREAAGLSARAAEEKVKQAVTPDDQERLVREGIAGIREIVK